MPIVRSLDTADRVPEATLGDFAPDTKRSELGARGAPQVVQRKGYQAVLHALESPLA